MQDSIDSDFLRKPCAECEQHFKINLAQPSVMHTSCFVLFRIVMLVFLSTTEAATANVFEWTFIIESLIILSQFPLLPGIRWRCTPVFVIAQMFPWWWSVTSQALECLSSNLVRQRSKEERELHFHLNSMLDWLSFLKNYSLRSGLFYLDLWRTKTHTCLVVIHFCYRIINYVLHNKTQVHLPQMLTLRSCLSFLLSSRIKASLMGLANSEPHSPPLPNWRQDSQQLGPLL